MIKIINCNRKNYLNNLTKFLDLRRSGKKNENKTISKILKDIKKGDIIMSARQDNVLTTAKVLCVFETKITMGIREFVDFENGLYITPWHPIKYNNKWVHFGDSRYGQFKDQTPLKLYSDLDNNDIIRKKLYAFENT